jgi:hypothetical protein
MKIIFFCFFHNFFVESMKRPMKSLKKSLLHFEMQTLNSTSYNRICGERLDKNCVSTRPGPDSNRLFRRYKAQQWRIWGNPAKKKKHAACRKHKQQDRVRFG